MQTKQNGIEYYNKEEENNNKEQDIAKHICDVSLGRTSSSDPTDIGSLAQGSSEPREVEVVLEGAEEAPLSDLNVKRALFTMFNNDGGRRNLAVRLNLADDTNADFVASLQPRSNITNYLKHTGEFKESAREWFRAVRKYGKENYTMPQQGKWHENVHRKGKTLQPIQVEPMCYASAAYDPEDKQYVMFVKLYDLILWDVPLDAGYLSAKQKETGVRGQYLWINPRFDTRVRPLTWAQKRQIAKK